MEIEALVRSSLFFLVTFGCGVFFCRKDKYAANLFMSLYSLFYILVIMIHQYSFEIGREGFTIFTRGKLVDDEVYHYGAIILLDGFHEGRFAWQEVCSFMQALYGYEGSSFLAAPFTSIIATIYLLFGKELLVAQTFVALISSLVVVAFYLLLRRIIQSREKAIVFTVPLIFYPMFLVRSLQLEKDNLINLLILVSMLMVLRAGKNLVSAKRKVDFKRKIVFGLEWVCLFALRFYTAVLLTISRVLSKRRFIYKVVCISVFPAVVIGMLVLPYISKELFDFVDTAKEYSVLAGQTGVIVHDYTSVIGIVRTYAISLLYFFFAPVPTQVAHAGTLWLLVSLEPIIFFYPPLFVIILAKVVGKRIPNEYKRFSRFLVLFALVYSFTAVTFDSQVQSYMRRRIPVYIILYIISILYWGINANRRRFTISA